MASFGYLGNFIESKKGETVSPLQLLRGGGMAAALGSALLIIVALISLVYLSFFFSPSAVSEADITVSQIRSFLAFLGRTLLVLGLVGLYVSQSEATGIPGLIGFLIAFLGLVAGPGGAGAALFANIGWALLGVASLRAGLYPRTITVLLIVGAVVSGVINGLTIGVPSGILLYAGTVASIVFYGAIAWLGYALWVKTGAVDE